MKTKKNPFLQISAATFAAATFASFAPQSAQAASGSWLPAVDGIWGVDANWNGATFPNGEGQTANFSVNTPDLLITTTLDGNYTVSTSAINSGNSSDWLVTSPTNTLTFDNTGTSNSQISNGFNGDSTYTLDTNMVLNSNLVLFANGNNNAKVTLGTTVGGRTITGVGNITLNNSSVNSAGALTINSNINTTGAIFNTSSQGSNSLRINGIIGSTVTGVTQNSTRNFTLSGANTYTSATTVSSGNLIAGVASVANVSGAFGNNSAVTIGNAAATSLNLNGFNNQIGSLAGGGGAVLLGTATLTTGADNTSTVFAGAISGTGGFTKIGSGAFTLTGINTLTGPVNVNVGTLVAGRAGSADISTTSAINLNGGDIVFQTDGTFAKTFTKIINVNNPATLSYDNTGATDQILTLSAAEADTDTLNLVADLTVRNTSDVETLVNGINFTRKITGAGDMIVESYNNVSSSIGDYRLGRIQLSGDNSGWSGDLKISEGVVTLSGASANTTGTGTIALGETGNAFGAGLGFNTSNNLIYPNNLVVNSGGFRAIRGNNFNGSNMTFSGPVTLNGSLTVDHSRSAPNSRIAFTGAISGTGGLTITRVEGSVGSTTLLTGVSDYSGPTLVTTGASLSIFAAGSIESDITVQSAARLGGGGGTSGNLTLNEEAKFFFFVGVNDPQTYNGFDVGGTVTMINPSTFGIASIVGGSQGEPVPWAAIPNGTYTLINTTSGTFSGISNLGSNNSESNILSSGKTVYFENSGGSLQIVIQDDASDPFTAWSGGAAFNVDTNNDGIGNGLAFLLGAADVNENANRFLPAPTQSGGALTLTFAMRNTAARGSASLQVQHSSDLGVTDPWSTLVTVPDATSTVSGINFTVAAGVAPLNNVTATIPSGDAANGKLFGRVKANP